MDIDPEEIGRNYPVEVGIVGDIKMVLKQILDLSASFKKNEASKWIKETQAWRKKWEEKILPTQRLQGDVGGNTLTIMC